MNCIEQATADLRRTCPPMMKYCYPERSLGMYNPGSIAKTGANEFHDKVLLIVRLEPNYFGKWSCQEDQRIQIRLFSSLTMFRSALQSI